MSEQIQLTNADMLNSYPVLKKLSQLALTVKASYAIAKDMAAIGDELQIYYSERQKLIDQYAEFDKDGKLKSDAAGNIVFKFGCADRWHNAITDLLGIQSDISIRKVNINDLCLGDITIAPNELMAIDFMLDE